MWSRCGGGMRRTGVVSAIHGGIVLLLALTPAGVLPGQEASVRWTGVLTLRGAEKPVDLRVMSTGDSAVVLADFPDLMMSGLPLAASGAPGSLVITWPFGLGPVAVDLTGPRAVGSAALGTDTLSIILERAREPERVSREVFFESDGDTLRGTVMLPSTPGPHPAAVLIHGSGRHSRQTVLYRAWADLLVRNGVAVLFYDKRGVGASGGSYGAGFAQLSRDASAAVHALRSQPEIDAGRVGLHGWSQGGWIGERVAADRGDIAFLMFVSAAAVTPRAQEFQKVEAGLRDDGRPESDIEDALAYLGLYFYVVRTGEGWPLLETAIAQAQETAWGDYVDQPRGPDDLAWWRENHAAQPAAMVADLRMPVLLLYGGADWIVPPIENAERLRALFPEPSKVEVHVFPRADHRLEVPSWIDAAGRWNWPQIAPGLVPAVEGFLQRVVR